MRSYRDYYYHRDAFFACDLRAKSTDSSGKEQEAGCLIRHNVHCASFFTSVMLKKDSLTYSSEALYALFDIKAGYFHPPFVFHGDSEAIRWIHRAFTGPQFAGSELAGSLMARYPQDFILYRLAAWSQLDGVLPFADSGSKVVVSSLADIIKPSPVAVPVSPDAKV
jgi:hypothetical protein